MLEFKNHDNVGLENKLKIFNLEDKTMYRGESKSVVEAFQKIVEGLPEGKIRKILTYANQVKRETFFPPEPLSTEEILILAEKRAQQLRKQPRPVVASQYKALLNALEAEVKDKAIQVEEFPSGD